MLKNYFKTTIRSILRHKSFSVINIVGLAVSMSICLGIIMLVADQLTYDRYNTKRHRVYRIFSTISGSANSMATSPMPLKDELLENYTGIEKVVQFKRGFGNPWIQFIEDVNIPLSGLFADPEVLDVFEYELLYGDPKTALIEPYTVVLTKRAAEKLFKEENPVGLSLKVGDKGTYKVTGVLKDKGTKSHIVFEGLASMASYRSLQAQGVFKKSISTDWSNYWDTWNYILVEKEKSAEDIQSYLEKIYSKHIAVITNPDISKATFALQPLTDISPGMLLNNAIGPFLPWIFIYFFAGLAALIMVTSCFNFTNLSIARSLTRAREIGVRKVSGAARWQIFSQFLSESIIISLFALLLAMVLLMIVKPMMLNLTFARVLKWDLEANTYVYLVFVGFAVLIGVIAGLFPAIVLSGFQPIKVLKNFGTMKLFSRMGLRKGLLVAQFTLSLIFILTVIVIYNQLQLFVRADHGFTMSENIVVKLNNTSAQALAAELTKHSNIKSVAPVSHVLAASSTYGTGFKKTFEEKEWTSVDYYSVNEEYLQNLDLKLVAGRNFNAEAGESNKNFIVVNETVVTKFGYKTPHDALGQVLIQKTDSSKLEIIGVVKDYNHQMLVSKIEPLALMYDPSSYQVLQVRYSGSKEGAIETIESSWSKINPLFKLDYITLEDEIHTFYNTLFKDLVNIVMFISFLAIFISCLGLLGMATYSTETRIKEISIRKVLGSSDSELIYLLSRGFVGILMIAILIAVPAAYFINNLWLNLIAYHVSFDLIVITRGVMILLVFGIVTIGSQTIRAKYVNPVENLKNE